MNVSLLHVELHICEGTLEQADHVSQVYTTLFQWVVPIDSA